MSLAFNHPTNNFIVPQRENIFSVFDLDALQIYNTGENKIDEAVAWVEAERESEWQKQKKARNSSPPIPYVRPIFLIIADREPERKEIDKLTEAGALFIRKPPEFDKISDPEKRDRCLSSLLEVKSQGTEVHLLSAPSSLVSQNKKADKSISLNPPDQILDEDWNYLWECWESNEA